MYPRNILRKHINDKNIIYFNATYKIGCVVLPVVKATPSKEEVFVAVILKEYPHRRERDLHKSRSHDPDSRIFLTHSIKAGNNTDNAFAPRNFV